MGFFVFLPWATKSGSTRSETVSSVSLAILLSVSVLLSLLGLYSGNIIAYSFDGFCF